MLFVDGEAEAEILHNLPIGLQKSGQSVWIQVCESDSLLIQEHHASSWNFLPSEVMGSAFACIHDYFTVPVMN